MKEFAAHLDNHKLLQFLFGLNEHCFNTRSQLLLMTPLSTVNQAFSVLAQDEHQRVISSSGNSILSEVVHEPLAVQHSIVAANCICVRRV